MGPQVTEMALSCAERRLAARLIDASAGTPGPPAVLFIHGLRSGQASYRLRAGTAASRLGAACLTFDLGGHGDSDGELDALSPRDHLADACCAYDALCAAAAPDPARIGVCGASYGGYLAVLLAGERPVSRLLLRAPALFADAMLDVPTAERGAASEPPPASLVLERLAVFGGETLVLESEHDAVIPHATIEAYVRSSPRVRHAVIADATHHLAEPAWDAEFVAHVVDWFTPL